MAATNQEKIALYKKLLAPIAADATLLRRINAAVCQASLEADDKAISRYGRLDKSRDATDYANIFLAMEQIIAESRKENQ